MSSRTLPTSHDTLAALAAFLQAELTGQQIQVHGAELPAGWQPSTAVKGVLIQREQRFPVMPAIEFGRFGEKQ